ncbi:hypothetical protein BJY00DRAFT_296213 [Aspergillus carlsbadensis]|nr:hypothetical protein BJY00DRAFT_296213 [Aspergillus carlsbadensis]
MTTKSSMPEQTDGPRPQPGFTLNFLAAFIIAFLAIAAYNTLELLIWIFHFFKRRRGLYFWSILACTLSVGLFTLASILQAFVLAPLTFTIPVVAISFPTMLAAQSLILYSRLHLISTPSALLRFVFWGIIVTSVFLHIPFAINSIGFTVNTARFSPPQVYVEWYMITGDVAREVFICGLYLYQAIRQLRPIIEMKGQAGRCIMVHLMLVNVAVIVFNVLALCVVYKGPSMMGSAYLSFAQSVKLRMEFVVLLRS